MTALLRDQPFFGSLALRLPIRADATRETLASDGKDIRYAPQWVERAVKEGVHVIYTDGYGRLREELESVSHNFLLDSRIAAQICAVLSELGEAKVNAGYVKTRHKFIMHSLERREALEASAARRGVAFPDLADYDSWRNSADEAVSRGEDILANPEDYGLHLHSAARGGESLASALSGAREMLADDDLHLAETLVGRRQGESVWEREEHVARLLNDPDELRKLRHQRAERRRTGQRQRKRRYQSRGITM